MFFKSWNCHCKARLKLKFMLSTKSYIRCESKIGCSSFKLCLKGLCLELILSAKLDMWGDDIYQNICLVHWKYSFSKIWRLKILLPFPALIHNNDQTRLQWLWSSSLQWWKSTLQQSAIIFWPWGNHTMKLRPCVRGWSYIMSSNGKGAGGGVCFIKS